MKLFAACCAVFGRALTRLLLSNQKLLSEQELLPLDIATEQRGLLPVSGYALDSKPAALDIRDL